MSFPVVLLFLVAMTFIVGAILLALVVFVVEFRNRILQERQRRREGS